MSDEPSKKEVLEALRDQVKEYVTAEKLRLVTERTFLKSVLDNSLGSPEEREKKYNEVVVIDNVKSIIGIVPITNEQS